MNMPWFRMYTDFLDDPKMVALAFEDQRHFIGVLALKSAGVLDTDCDPALLNRIVSQKLWIDFSLVNEVKNRLINAKLIDKNWQPVAWEKRQFKSDHDVTGAERQHKFRENKRNALRNGDSNALRNESVTLPETETETETNTPLTPVGGICVKADSKTAKPELTPGFANFWQTWPNTDRKQARGKCFEIWKKARLEADAAVICGHVIRMKNCENWIKQGGQFIPSPVPYLTQRRWEGADESSLPSNDLGVWT